MDQLIEFASNNIILAGIWLALVIMLIYSYVSGLISSVKEVSVHEMMITVIICRKFHMVPSVSS